MSAPQIPNLTTLRRGGLRNRGRGSGGVVQDGGRPGQSKQSKDDIIRSTDNDAALSRLSAVEAGYLDDPIAALLSTGDGLQRRLPLMNRGTYVRTTGIDRIVDTFLSSQQEQRAQIISLGAGSDTRFFRIRKRYPSIDLLYHELDFSANTRTKIASLRSSAFVNAAMELCQIDLRSPDIEVLDGDTRLRSRNYCVHPIDLRTLSPGQTPPPDIDTSLPTLLISECCLIYLSPDHADAVLQYFTQLFPKPVPLAIVIYEPIRPYDSFGRTMVSNLTARGIQLHTLEKYADLEAQKDRLDHAGFGDEGGGAESADIEWIWKDWIDSQEKDRVDGLEWMDEVEEYILLAQHYCIAWGWRSFEKDELWKRLKAAGSS